jgi:lipid A 3-O-deacylase
MRSKLHHKQMKYALFALLFSMAIIFAADVNAQNTYRNQVGGRLDNDQYINPYNDRYYMAGHLLNFTTVLNSSKDCAGLLGGGVFKKTLELEVGQQIYGPFATWARYTFIQDRPYTGYLYAGASLNWLYENESALKITAQVGTIGPASMAEKVQKTFHKAFDLKDPEGWEYQLNNEVGLNLEAQYTRLLYRNNNDWLDVAATPSLRIGNTFSNATAAVQLRIGSLDKFYQSASTNSRVSLGGDHQKHELYFFAIPQLSYVAYNATIQGGMFIKDKGPVHYDIHHLVFTQQLGVQLATNRWSASYTALIRTLEVKSTALGQQWGSIALAYRFAGN